MLKTFKYWWNYSQTGHTASAIHLCVFSNYQCKTCKTLKVSNLTLFTSSFTNVKFHWVRPENSYQLFFHEKPLAHRLTVNIIKAFLSKGGTTFAADLGPILQRSYSVHFTLDYFSSIFIGWNFLASNQDAWKIVSCKIYTVKSL